jgi:hypothetical protein
MVSGITGLGRGFSTGVTSVVFFSSNPTCGVAPVATLVTGGRGALFAPWTATPFPLPLVDRRVAATGNPVPNVPVGLGSADRPIEPGAAGDGKTGPEPSDVNRFPLLRCIDGGSCGGPGGNGRAGTAKDSCRTGLPKVETRVSISFFFAGRRSGSVSLRFLDGGFGRKSGRVIVIGSDLVVKEFLSTRFVRNWGGGPKILE